MRTVLILLAGGTALSGCALKGDVRRVESQVVQLREETARADSARAVALARILDRLDRLNADVADSLAEHRQSLMALRGEFRADLTDVMRQLVSLQELAGQSQAGLNELRRQLEDRQLAPPPAEGGEPAGEGEAAAGPGPEEIFQIGIQQYRQGSPTTARMAFRTVLDSFPQHPRASDALYFVGETFEADDPDSAVATYELVVERYPEARRAPAALYKLGLLAEQRGDAQGARLHFQRLIVSYPESEEAERAREKLIPS